MKPKSVTIVFMGDSITEGQYVKHALRWTDLLNDRFTREYLDTPINLMILNKGISGETTRQGLERFAADVQNFAPEVMTLQFGLNDCNCWVSDRGLPRVSPAAYRANLIEMIERARRFGTREIILATNHQTLRHKVLLSGYTLEEGRKRFNDIVREVANETKVTLCDIDAGFAHFDREAIADMLLPYPDHLHLSPEGHKHYAELMSPYLAAAIRNAISD